MVQAGVACRVHGAWLTLIGAPRVNFLLDTWVRSLCAYHVSLSVLCGCVFLYKYYLCTTHQACLRGQSITHACSVAKASHMHHVWQEHLTCEKEVVVVTWLKEVESYRRVTCEKEVES